MGVFRAPSRNHQAPGYAHVSNDMIEMECMICGAPIRIEDADEDGEIVCDACLEPDFEPDPEVLHGSDPDK